MTETDPGKRRIRGPNGLSHSRSHIGWDRLNAPVDIAWLAAFRILFGLLMCAAMVRFLAKGWVSELFLAPGFHFTYEGFAWVRPWETWGMHLHVVALAVLSLGVCVGLFYRWCIVLFFLGFTYLELIDQATYLNHYYLISLLSGLLIFMPAHRALSLDAWRRPQFESPVVPAWTLSLLRFQVAAVYLFAALAKLTPDWLFAAQPLRVWLAARSDLPGVGPWLDEAWVAYAASWIGAFYDLSIVFFLLARRTRAWAYAVVVLFHLATWVLFPIGMFPWIMMVATTVFFSPDWPRRWLRLRSWNSESVAVPARLRSPVAWSALGVFVAWQVLFPLRGFKYRDPSGWTYRGFNFAWRVMIVEKAGHVEFTVRDPETDQRWRIRPRDHLTPLQERAMAQDPEMIRTFARHIAANFRRDGKPKVEVRATAFASLNGRPSQLLIDPNVDLAASLPPPDCWILRLSQ